MCRIITKFIAILKLLPRGFYNKITSTFNTSTIESNMARPIEMIVEFGYRNNILLHSHPGKYAHGEKVGLKGVIYPTIGLLICVLMAIRFACLVIFPNPLMHWVMADPFYGMAAHKPICLECMFGIIT